MKLTYEEFEDTGKMNNPKRKLLEQELVDRQKRCRERTLTVMDVRLKVSALLRKLTGILTWSERSGMTVIISPNHGQHYGRKHGNRQFIETKIYVLFTKSGFELRFYREQPENRYYTFKMVDEQSAIISKKLFEKFNNRD